MCGEGGPGWVRKLREQASLTREDTHEQKCPAASSARGCIPIAITAEIVEE